MNLDALEVALQKDLLITKVSEVRKLLKKANSWSFTSAHSVPALLFGTILMWISLCFFVSGFSLDTVT